MENKGLIVKRKGKGSFVARPKIHESLIHKLTGFYQDMVERGFTPVTQVLHHDVEPAKPKVAGRLGLEPGTPVFNIERLRSVNDEPINLVRTFLPHALCPGLSDVDLSNHSLYAVLEDEFGLVLSHGQRAIEAVIADEREACLLGIERGAPLIYLESVTYLQDGTPIEYYQALHRGDRSRFEVSLLRLRQADEAEDCGWAGRDRHAREQRRPRPVHIGRPVVCGCPIRWRTARQSFFCRACRFR